MSFGKVLLLIFGILILLYGFLNILGAFGPGGGGLGWVLIGVILMAVGAVPVYFAIRKPAGETNVTLKIDLPGNVNLDTLKCKSCGGALTPKDIKMVAGAPVVTCPYCNTTYQLTEEPKW
jgi:membrane protease YdiL (CAAX protease family)